MENERLINQIIQFVLERKNFEGLANQLEQSREYQNLEAICLLNPEAIHLLRQKVQNLHAEFDHVRAQLEGETHQYVNPDENLITLRACTAYCIMASALYSEELEDNRLTEEEVDQIIEMLIYYASKNSGQKNDTALDRLAFHLTGVSEFWSRLHHRRAA